MPYSIRIRYNPSGKPKLICNTPQLILLWQVLINFTDQKELVLLLLEKIQDYSLCFLVENRKKDSVREPKPSIKLQEWPKLWNFPITILKMKVNILHH